MYTKDLFHVQGGNINMNICCRAKKHDNLNTNPIPNCYAALLMYKGIATRKLEIAVWTYLALWLEFLYLVSTNRSQKKHIGLISCCTHYPAVRHVLG
jgi:hypothetical protein